MPFPQTLDELKSAGYKFSDYGVCRGCGEDVEWWTTPRGKNIPMNPMDTGTSKAIPHWSTCSDAPLFRKERGI